MIIKNLELKNYRNYEKLEIEFNPNLNIIIGNNAQGKTNILESIYLLSITKSFLGIKEKKTIKIGNDFSIIKADLIDNYSKKKLELILTESGKKVKINNKEIKKLSEYISTIKTIIFSPDNIRILKEGPNTRRKFLNMEISQISIEYLRKLNEYNNILKQRNEYLKNNNIDNTYLDIINDKFADYAIYIFEKRKSFIEEINKNITNIFYEISKYKNIKVNYITNIDYNVDKNIMKSQFIDKLNKNINKELKYNITLYGIHRDDFNITLNDINIIDFGSQAQLRMAILSLNLAEIEIFKNRTNEFPILLLDDIFSELDISKRNNLISFITKNVQTILTTTDLNMIDNKILEKSKIFTIKDGQLIENNMEEGK